MQLLKGLMAWSAALAQHGSLGFERTEHVHYIWRARTTESALLLC